MKMTISNLSSDQLRQAAKIKDQIESLQTQLIRILGQSDLPPLGVTPMKKRGMSLAARRKIAAAQKARWEKAKARTKPSIQAKPAKRKFSAAARAKIAAAAKKRWAKAKAAGKKTLKGS